MFCVRSCGTYSWKRGAGDWNAVSMTKFLLTYVLKRNILLYENSSKQTIACPKHLFYLQPLVTYLNAYSLDVWDETGETRISQFEEVNEHMKASNHTNVCCLGDFNALRRSDYTPQHWNWMVSRDRKRNVKTVYNTMEYAIDELKWRDSFEESPNFQGKKKAKNFAMPCVTSWPLRRIDFALLSPQFALNVVNTMIVYEATSDHLPIAMDIQLPR